MAGWARVATLDELAPGSLLDVEAGGQKICLARTEDGDVYALRDNCSHKDYPLSLGELDGEELECTWHGARFDVTTGRALCLPAIKPVETFEVRIEEGAVLVALPGD